MTITTVNEMTAIFTDIFGDHAIIVDTDHTNRHVTAVVRERFEIAFALEPEHGMFNIAARIGPTLSTTTFFGQPPLLDPSEESVREMMTRVHHWTTLRIAPQSR